MLWEITAPPCNVDQFATRDIVEVLYEFEGPRIFVTAEGSLRRLWYECGADRDTETLRYLVVPADARLVAQLKDGTKTVHDALRQPWLWAVDIDCRNQVIGGWVVSLDEVPETAKPERDAPLWPHLEPLISYRLVGDGLREGAIPASVVARAMERPAAALKRLLEAKSNTTAQGRPEEAFRRAYDLPARRFAFNSFEVSFAMPVQAELPVNEAGETVYESGAVSLDAAFAWLESSEHGPEPDIAMLEVLKELVPPAHGQVTQTELRGQLVATRGTVVLTRQDRTTVTQAIGRRQRLDRELLRTEGRIGEFDKDELTLILRDRSDVTEALKCSFTEDQFDDLYESFNFDRRVVVIGRMHASRNVLEIVAAEAVPNTASLPISVPPPRLLEDDS